MAADPRALYSTSVVYSARGSAAMDVLPLLATRKSRLRVNACGERHIPRSEEHTSELQSRGHLVCRLLLEKKNLSSASISLIINIINIINITHNYTNVNASIT